MTTEHTDFYAILGVAPSATQVEISCAYRTLLRRHHPDTRSTGDQPQSARSDAALQHVIAAYAVLHDPLRRAEYDRTATSEHNQPGTDRSRRRTTTADTAGHPSSPARSAGTRAPERLTSSD